MRRRLPALPTVHNQRHSRTTPLGVTGPFASAIAGRGLVVGVVLACCTALLLALLPDGSEEESPPAAASAPMDHEVAFHDVATLDAPPVRSKRRVASAPARAESATVSVAPDATQAGDQPTYITVHLLDLGGRPWHILKSRRTEQQPHPVQTTWVDRPRVIIVPVDLRTSRAPIGAYSSRLFGVADAEGAMKFRLRDQHELFIAVTGGTEADGYFDGRALRVDCSGADFTGHVNVRASLTSSDLGTLRLTARVTGLASLLESAFFFDDGGDVLFTESLVASSDSTIAPPPRVTTVPFSPGSGTELIVTDEQTGVPLITLAHESIDNATSTEHARRLLDQHDLVASLPRGSYRVIAQRDESPRPLFGSIDAFGSGVVRIIAGIETAQALEFDGGSDVLILLNSASMTQRAAAGDTSAEFEVAYDDGRVVQVGHRSDQDHLSGFGMPVIFDWPIGSTSISTPLPLGHGTLRATMRPSGERIEQRIEITRERHVRVEF